MIAATSLASQFGIHACRSARWQQVLADAITDPAELCALLGLDPALIAAAPSRPLADFPLRVPRGYVARMRRGDPRDPLLLQVLPWRGGTDAGRGLRRPIRSATSRSGAAPGLLHKYAGRALLVATGACAVHCRYCFRRHFPYAEQSALQQGWQPRSSGCAPIPSISEVILSGGDPLSLSDRRLAQLTDALQADAARSPPAHPHALPDRAAGAHRCRACSTGCRRCRCRRSWSSMPIMPHEIDAHGAACLPRAGSRRRDAAEPVGAARRGQRHASTRWRELSEALFETQRPSLLPAPAG